VMKDKSTKTSWGFKLSWWWSFAESPEEATSYYLEAEGKRFAGWWWWRNTQVRAFCDLVSTFAQFAVAEFSWILPFS
jgi:hypothetical protein